MSDLEMIRLCAEAMGVEFVEQFGRLNLCDGTNVMDYDPLHDDAQAMALVKRFGIRSILTSGDLVEWSVTIGAAGPFGSHAMNADLNRAIVECVAKMHAPT